MSVMNINNIKVSICVPIYGVENYIERCVRSLFVQTYENIEYVFVNDLTKDNSISILNKVLLDYPKRIPQVKIINHTSNRGLAASRNTAVENATGDYLLHVDSDDWIEPNTVDVCITDVKKGNYDLVFFNGTVYRNDYFEYMNVPMNTTKKDLLEDVLSFRVRHNIWGVFIRKDIYINNNIHAIEGCNMGEDFQVLPLLLYHSNKISSLGISLYNYDRRNVQSITSSFSEKNAKQNWRSIDYIYNFFATSDNKYMDFLEVYKLKTIFFQIKNCILYSSNYEYYNYVLNRLNNIDKKYWSKISILRRLVFHIKNRKLLLLYLIVLTKTNVIVKAIYPKCRKI